MNNNKKELTLQELENQLYIHEMKLLKEKEKKQINTLDKYFNINIIKKNNIVY
jgi:hypothetical protein